MAKRTPAKEAKEPKSPRAASASASPQPKPKSPSKSKSPSPAASSSSSSRAPAPSVTHLHVYLFVPNLIGYARVLLTAASVFLLATADVGSGRTPPLTESGGLSQWTQGLVAYSTSFILDFFDGFAARRFDQSSDFGAVLDMVTDRVSTMLLLTVLCRIDPANYFWYAFLAALDYSSHWVQMYSSKGHHKSASANSDKNILVRLFYGVYPLFAYCCAGTEFFYILRVAGVFYADETLIRVNNYLLLPACVMKNVINVAQLMSGFESVAKGDVEKRRG